MERLRRWGGALRAAVMKEAKVYREHVYQGNQEGMHWGASHSFNVCQQSLFTTCGFLAFPLPASFTLSYRPAYCNKWGFLPVIREFFLPTVANAWRLCDCWGFFRLQWGLVNWCYMNKFKLNLSEWFTALLEIFELLFILQPTSLWNKQILLFPTLISYLFYTFSLQQLTSAVHSQLLQKRL